MTSTSTNTQTISSLPSLTPQRIQSLKTFLASDEPITINPSFAYKSPLDFLLTQEPIPPLQPGIDTTVPLWLALYLRKRNLCRLKCPSWMTVPRLKAILAHERDPTQDNFSQDLPFRHAEISRAILQSVGASRSAVHASGGSGGSGEEEVPQAEVVRVLLEDIAMVRMDKIRRNFHSMSADTMGKSLEMPMSILDVTGIGSMEMAAVKPFLEKAFEDHLKLVRAGTGTSSSGDGGDGDGENVDGDGGQGKRSRNLRLSSRRSRKPITNQTNVVVDDDDDDDNDDDNESDHAHANVGALDDFEMDPNPNTSIDVEPGADADAAPAVSKSRIRRYRS